jgi:hypothetical protein
MTPVAWATFMASSGVIAALATPLMPSVPKYFCAIGELSFDYNIQLAGPSGHYFDERGRNATDGTAAVSPFN